MYKKLLKKLLNKYWGIYTGLGDSFLENLQGITTLKIYEADNDRTIKMDIEAQKFRKVTMKVLTMQLNSTSVMDIVAYGGAAVGMIVAVNEYLLGDISFSHAIIIVLLAAEFFLPLRLLGSYFHIAMNGMAASDKVFEFLDLEEYEEKEKIIEDDSIEITIKNMNFSYDNKRDILKGVNIKFEPRGITALVGVSGCGKSTIGKLLTGRNKEYSGNIKLNSIELSEINEENLLRNITMVNHNSYLFKGTVRENLLMAKEDAADDELYKVLKEVNIYDFLENEMGIDTIVKEKGSNFSGGQCQRIALARALLHNSPVYIFDEATSNIDVESEELIMNVIAKLSQSKTVILISHRLANVIKADNIYLLKDGSCAEVGTHNELLDLKGDYYELYNKQSELETFGI